MQRLAIALLLAASAVGCSRGPRPARHLVLVVFDTLQAGHMSLYGYPRATTPFLETAKGRCLLFSGARATAPWTIPSHASMFTGLWPAEHRAQWGRMVLSDRATTLAEMLEGAGFSTAAFSSNLLVVRETGLTQGFTDYELIQGSWDEKTSIILERLPAIIDRALSRDKRLFLFLNLMDTHIPYNSGRYGKDFGLDGPAPVTNAAEKWEVSAGARQWTEADRRRHVAAYDAAVRTCDDTAKAVATLLADKGILDDTLLVFTSDHGEGLGLHQEIGHTVSVWEEQLHVPLMIHFPGDWRGGEVEKRPTTLHALTPSLLDWLGVPRPADLQGAATLLEAEDAPVTADYRSYFSERNRKENTALAEAYPDLAARVQHRHVLYCGSHKLIIDAGGGVSFYDLAADPDEQHDLAASNPPELARCGRTYREALAAGRFTPFTEEVSAEESERSRSRVKDSTLKSLGYVK